MQSDMTSASIYSDVAVVVSAKNDKQFINESYVHAENILRAVNESYTDTIIFS